MTVAVIGTAAVRVPAAFAQGQPVAAEVAAPSAAPSAPFGFEDVARMAAELAARDHKRPTSTLSGPFADLGYDAYRGIRFRREADPWRALPGWGLDLLPPGMLYTDPVLINLVQDGVARPLPFDPAVFDYDENSFPPEAPQADPGDMGWSGFRLRTVLNRPDFLDELAVFQGASYFRVLSQHARYGLSARGLALRTGSPQGEEFPFFREFWIHTPDLEQGSVTVEALLDSPSVAGAFRLVIHPGADTVVATQVALFPRRELVEVGLAPLTSMYWFGPADGSTVDDYRSAVHDSDGLEMVTGAGERLWRVLHNPGTLQMSAFMDENPHGFGLMQRSREFEDYHDAEAAYELRPSAWVTPRGDWGAGAVSLVEIPVQNEFHDNIVAFWRPSEPLAAGARHDFAYDLTFSLEPQDDAPLARVRATRTGRSVNRQDARSVVIDFDLSLFRDQPDPVAAVTASAGKVDAPYLIRLPEAGLLRLAFEFVPDDDEVADLSAVLTGPAGVLSETWLARWSGE